MRRDRPLLHYNAGHAEDLACIQQTKGRVDEGKPVSDAIDFTERRSDLKLERKVERTNGVGR